MKEKGLGGRNKVGKTRVVPLVSKILLVFTIFLLLSNFTSNYINLTFNQAELVKLMKQLLIKDMKEIYTFANNQNEIFKFNNDEESVVNNLENRALEEFSKEKSIAVGVRKDGTFFFQSSKLPKAEALDARAVDAMVSGLETNKTEGVLNFTFNKENYFGIYKYNKNWDVFILRAEEMNEFYKDSNDIFLNITLIILVITVISILIGIIVLKSITKFISMITHEIMKMIDSQELGHIALDNATNDEITYMGMAFNSLSSTVNNLLTIFRKFVNKDIVVQAYEEREVRLEGRRRDLTMLFTDIKSFTYMTETLGTDIIKLINMHYDRAIREIIHLDGVIGSIIGDALLAVFGAIDENRGNKSFQAIQAGYRIQRVAESLRLEMHKRREELVRERGGLNELETKIYKAVLIEVGVGIDGGMVFYGNIGSYERMTNTVIGDNVNSSSRLEGLTRVYKVPVICSDYIMNDVEENVPGHGLTFIELDTVQVKGKTIGKKVYWPIPQEHITPELEQSLNAFNDGLKLYYQGSWSLAYNNFKNCNLPLAEVFIERTNGRTAPANWRGIWTMKTK